MSKLVLLAWLRMFRVGIDIMRWESFEELLISFRFSVVMEYVYSVSLSDVHGAGKWRRLMTNNKQMKPSEKHHWLISMEWIGDWWILNLPTLWRKGVRKNRGSYKNKTINIVYKLGQNKTKYLLQQKKIKISQKFITHFSARTHSIINVHSTSCRLCQSRYWKSQWYHRETCKNYIFIYPKFTYV